MPRRFHLIPMVVAAVLSGSNLFPMQYKAGVVQAIPGVGGAADACMGGSGRYSSISSAILFFVDDLDGSAVTSATYSTYTKVYHGTVRGAASLTGPRMVIFNKEGTIDLGGTDLRMGSEVTMCGQYAPGKGVLFVNGQISTAITFGSPSAVHQHYMHIPVAPGDGAASAAYPASENWDGWQFGGGDNTGANAPNWILLDNCGGHYWQDEGGDGYYGNPSGYISIRSSIFSRGLSLSAHTEGGVPEATGHAFALILGDGKKWKAADTQRCYFGHVTARMPMVAAEFVNSVNDIIANPGDTVGNIAQGIRVSNDYDAASPNTGAMKANHVACVAIKGPDGYSSFPFLTCDPSGSDVATRVPSGSQGYGGHNMLIGWTAANQAALFSGNFPGSYVQSTLRTDAWAYISDTTDLSDVLKPAATEQNPNAYTTAEVKNVTNAVMACLGPLPLSRTGTIADRDAINFTAMIDNTSGKGQVINSVSGTDNPAGYPDNTKRFTPNDGGYPTYGSATTSIASILATYFTITSGEPDNSLVTSGTFSNGRPKAGLTLFEVANVTKHFEVGGQ